MVTARSPTAATFVLFVVVFALQTVSRFFGLFDALFVLSAPLVVNPWTVVTSIYAHVGPGHLLSNAFGLLLFGGVIERETSSLRYHSFFVTAGGLAGIAEVTVGGLLGPPRGVLGASGAVFAFMGYFLASNRLTETAIGGFRLSTRAQLLLFVAIAVAVTVATGRPGVALIAHFTGLFLGLLAGRVHLLRVQPAGR